MANEKISILILEDEPALREFLSERLMILGPIYKAATKDEAYTILSKEKIDLAFIDLNIDGQFDGLEVVRRAANKSIYTVVLTAHDSKEHYHEALAAGCQDFFAKTNIDGTIAEVVNKYISNKNSFKYHSFIENEFITKNPETMRTLEFALKNCTSDFPVLIQGETGIGKTRLAQYFHEMSGRSGQFVMLNCSEIAPSLIQSEIFGHKKGSFTGAINDYDGKIKHAHNGTLFIDEICSMPMDIQTKLLKVLEEKTFHQVGSNTLIHSNFRLICAARTDLVELVAQGKFRDDLYHRIDFVNIRLKPLRERKDDIPLLLNKFVSTGRRIEFTNDAIDMMVNYSWPGNIRELIKVVEMLRSDNINIIDIKDLPPQVLNNNVSGNLLSAKQYDHCLRVGIKAFLKNIEREVYARCLIDCHGVNKNAISKLGIGNHRFYNTLGLSNKMKQTDQKFMETNSAYIQ